MAAPSSSGFFELLTSPASITQRQLYVAALTNALRYGTGYGLVDPAYGLIKEPNVYEMIRRDAVIFAAIEARKHAVASSEWDVVPPREGHPSDKAVAKIIREILDRIEGFDGARLNLAEAVFRGAAYAKIDATRQVLGPDGSIPRLWVAPTRILDVDKRRVRATIDRTPGAAPRWKTEVANVFEGGRWEEVDLARRPWFIDHVYDDAEISLGYGRGLIDSIYHYWYAKCVALVEGLQGLERWAQGWVTLEVDPSRAGSTGKTNDEIVSAAVSELSKHRSQHVLAYMKGETLNVLPGPGAGQAIVMEFLNYLDAGVTRVILGSVMPSGGGDASDKGGSLARARVEQDSSENLIHFDRRLLEGTLTRTLIRTVFNANRLNFLSMGLGDAECPRFSLQPESLPDPDAMVERVTSLLSAQIPLRKKEVYEAIGFSQPPEGDPDVFEGSAPAPSPFGGGGEFPPTDGGAKTGDEPDGGEARDEFSARVAETMENFAEMIQRRDEVGPVHVHLPETLKMEIPPPNVTVNVPPAEVTVNVPTLPAPVVEVEVAAPVLPAPVVTVAPPIVNVAPPKVEVTVEAPKTAPRKVTRETTVERDASGNITKTRTTEV